MNTYKVKIQVEAEIQAFNEDDAADYINDIFGTDEEVKNIKISSIKEK
jgi:limonene-1,2-epoxide hydrolase